jgi:hypothetical protein
VLHESHTSDQMLHVLRSKRIQPVGINLVISRMFSLEGLVIGVKSKLESSISAVDREGEIKTELDVSCCFSISIGSRRIGSTMETCATYH